MRRLAQQKKNKGGIVGGFLFNLLGEGPSEIGSVLKATQNVSKIVSLCVTIFYGAVLALLIFFAIYLGWRLAKAEDDGQRKQAKAQLFYSIIGIVGVGMLIVFIRAIIPNVAPNIKELVNVSDEYATAIDLANTLGAVNDIIQIIIQILMLLVGVFACYVAWQFIKAEDDGKRKQAKTQLIYCFIAIVGIAMINLVAGIGIRLAFPTLSAPQGTMR